MNKNNKYIFLIVLFFISIGFAILSSNISIGSNLTISEASWNVYLHIPEIYNTNTEGATYTLNNDRDELTFTVNLDIPGEYIEYDFYVVNDGTIDASLNEINITGLESYSDYVNYNLRYADDDIVAINDIFKSKTRKRIIFRLDYRYDINSFISTNSMTINLALKFIQPQVSDEKVWNYEYQEELQKFVAQKSGQYKVETWGAQGGTATAKNFVSNQGYGGYSSGIVSLAKNDIMYLAVGGKGVSLTNKSIGATYNGGGSSNSSYNGDYNSSGGGGTSVYLASDVTYCSAEYLKLNNTDLNSKSTLIDDYIVLNAATNSNVFACGRSSKNVGEYYKVEWRGSGLDNSKIVYDGGIYAIGESGFKINRGVEIYGKRITNNLAEIWYKITENSNLTEFRMETNGAPINLISETVIKINNPLIVSGGGGGAHIHGNGKSYAGNGGGFKGTSQINYYQLGNNCTIGTGGSQTAGGFSDASGTRGAAGKFGLGGNYTSGYYGAGGGGGYYGGASGLEGGACAYSGTGGSGYIGNSNLSNKVMYCYNCEESNDESTKTISTTNVSDTPISNYAKMGNGHIRITYLG